MRDFIDRHGPARWALNFTLILITFGLLYWLESGNAADNRNTRRDFCVKVEQVRTYAREAATRALATLPTLAYYKAHPAELERALADVHRQVNFFSPPLDCNKFANSSGAP